MLRWLECKGMGTLISAMLLLEKWSLCTAHHSLARNIQNTVGQGDLQGQKEDCLYSSKAGKVKWHDGNNMKLKAGCKMWWI
jgi:hypothetical protein